MTKSQILLARFRQSSPFISVHDSFSFFYSSAYTADQQNLGD